ncbi:MAG: nucleoside 2-deoxyribosyltransferase [Roseovarius sp.]
MNDIVVVGGLYGERCVFPNVDELYGSGGRAALAIARAGYQVQWQYYCPKNLAPNAKLTVAWDGLEHLSHPCEVQVNFAYRHGLSSPVFFPGVVPKSETFRVEAKNVLRFGMMEGDPIVQADCCVFDPQSHNDPEDFHSNGSRAGRLSIVLNTSEVLHYGSASDETSAIQNIMAKSPDSTVLVKAGADGCRVYEGMELVGTVPPYWSNRVYKIGTGDVFSAAFAAHWAVEGRSALDAADIASRCVAQYTETRTPSVDVRDLNQDRKAIVQSKAGLVYIAGPIFTMAELWLVNEACDAFEELGMSVFSPYHDVGYGDPSKVVPADIEGLNRASAVFAVLDGCDPGTLFEVGFAVRRGIPVVAFSQNPKSGDLTMIKGSPDCFITDDFVTAIYQTTWLARR